MPPKGKVRSCSLGWPRCSGICRKCSGELVGRNEGERGAFFAQIDFAAAGRQTSFPRSAEEEEEESEMAVAEEASMAWQHLHA